MRHARPLALMGFYGFASGLPFMLSAFTLQQWLSEQGIALHAIGLTALIGLSYTLKFAWAPLFDRPAPRLLRRFGRRRGWLLPVQVLLTAAIAGFALTDPARDAARVILAAVAVAFLSACQDILIDAWRIELFPGRLQGAAMAAYVWGYRIALLVSGAGAIWLAGRLGWHGALLLVAGLSLLGPVVTLAAPEPAAAGSGGRGGLLARLEASVLAPMAEFLGRDGAAEILAFVVLFRLGEAVAGKMAVPFYHALGFDRAQVAAANFLPSLLAALAGTAVGAWLVMRLGAGRALILTGCAQAATMGFYLALAWAGADLALLYAKVTLESFTAAMADAAFITYLSGLCARAYTATQYALLSSVAAVALHTLGGLSGFLAEQLGWVRFYGLCMAATLPSILIMLHLLRRFPPGRTLAAASLP